MASIFDMLRLVEKSPEIYLTYLEEERGLQLRSLMVLITGYTEAVRAHGIKEPFIDFNGEFARYLRTRFGWSTSGGAIGAIIGESPTADAAWERFWPLLWEYEKSLNLPAA
ncbi:hypothetical protein HUA78_05630 [Myxococcus sp. CA033]|uniref:hypothetical protein n=1 Tax=Myxococcus sp. CA033 TaxID=2741516 RepID=UPI00157B6A83|nr:hypothetical protein [Myxococcus sp. CA033]NTX33910.1 hypothetical protein [Myxococcus sp. CA033]